MDSRLTAVIIGAGFGGIGMAIALRRAGIDDFLILEKAGDVGGVWRDNRYPGAACDVPAHLYSFSFEPNPDWSRAYAPQSEILDYLRHCAAKYGLARHMRFNAEVTQARFDEARSHWELTLADGTALRAMLLVSATGQLSRPLVPELPGRGDFQGPAFHASRWDAQADLAGKRVAVIGTGASAVQIVPALAGQAGRLMVFQRSPAYVLPRRNPAYSAAQQARFRRSPGAMRRHRAAIYLGNEWKALLFTRARSLLAAGARLGFLVLLKKQVPDPALRARLTPDYPMGCKRILLSSDYLAAFARPRVELVDQPIRRIAAAGIETADGVHHPVDAIVYATGFAATQFLAPMRITGRAGLGLDAAWRDGAHAYLGMAVPGFPNFFMLYGPNTNLGHTSIVLMLESQIGHVMRCLRAMRARQAGTIEVDAPACQAYNAWLRRRLARTAWQGCRSWYRDEAGRNTANWPGFSCTYRARARFSSLRAYRFSP